MTENQAALVIQQAYKKYMKTKSERYGLYGQYTPITEDMRLLFTDSRNNFFRLNMNRLSKSALGPEKKVYITDTSLFYSERESILIFGGLDPHGIFGTGRNTGKEIFRYVPHQNQWEIVGELPEPRQHHCVAFMKGRVYLVGGADPRDDDVRGKSIVVDTVWSFEPVKRSWFSEGSLNIPRKSFGLVVHKNHLLAIGGQDRQYKLVDILSNYLTSHEYKLFAKMGFPQQSNHISCKTMLVILVNINTSKYSRNTYQYL
ncbi:hypothetical protein HHI36_007476 [Cryptolaemus montrouzieri]|uniref:Uncharacterized protein n=1 Tax=Cryptolaemus montrouzieri TaxID=559131 RepID=A0ABD2MPM9_9CUCU